MWDRGSYEIIEIQNKTITFFLRGRKLKGIFTLLRLKEGRKGDEWLLVKKKDKYGNANWKLDKSLTPEKKSQLQEQIPPCKTA